MFGLSKENDWIPKPDMVGCLFPEAPVLIQGVQEYNTLCPVNPLTGHRDSPISILQYALSDKNRGLLDAVLQELPTIKQMDVSDDVKLDTLVSRLDCGSFAEQDEVRSSLMKISEVLLDSKQIDAPLDTSDAIQFNKTDNPAPDANI